jgi:hypothetical protein
MTRPERKTKGISRRCAFGSEKNDDETRLRYCSGMGEDFTEKSGNGPVWSTLVRPDFDLEADIPAQMWKAFSLNRSMKQNSLL